MFSSRSFIVSGLTLRPLIHLEFIFVYGVRKCSSFILLQVVDQISQHHLLKRLSLIHCIFLLPLSKIGCPYVRGFISGLSILFHWSIFLSLVAMDFCTGWQGRPLSRDLSEPGRTLGSTGEHAIQGWDRQQHGSHGPSYGFLSSQLTLTECSPHTRLHHLRRSVRVQPFHTAYPRVRPPSLQTYAERQLSVRPPGEGRWVTVIPTCPWLLLLTPWPVVLVPWPLGAGRAASQLDPSRPRGL